MYDPPAAADGSVSRPLSPDTVLQGSTAVPLQFGAQREAPGAWLLYSFKPPQMNPACDSSVQFVGWPVVTLTASKSTPGAAHMAGQPASMSKDGRTHTLG